MAPLSYCVLLRKSQVGKTQINELKYKDIMRQTRKGMIGNQNFTKTVNF